ncbi:MAG: hypothetical protein RIR33_3702 [Pseudomonadota bacterium]|jgi:hypothetical protein
MTPQQREEWLEEFHAWRTLPMTEAFFNSLLSEQKELQADWTRAVWESEADPPPDQLRQLRIQARTLDDVINRKGTDVLASLYPDLRGIAEGQRD